MKINFNHFNDNIINKNLQFLECWENINNQIPVILSLK